MRRIDGFRHRADSEGVNQLLLHRAFALREQMFDGFGSSFRAVLVLLVTFGQMHRVAELMHKLAQRLNFVGIGHVMHTVHYILIRAGQLHCYRSVSQQHKLLNQMMRRSGFLQLEPRGPTLFVNKHFDLFALKLYCAMFEAVLAQDIRKAVEFFDSGHHIAADRAAMHRFAGFSFTIDDILSLFVVQANIRTDDCTANLVLEHFGGCIHREDHRHGQFVLVRTERAELVTQALG